MCDSLLKGDTEWPICCYWLLTGTGDIHTMLERLLTLCCIDGHVNVTTHDNIGVVALHI